MHSKKTLVCVLTARGMAAISSSAVAGAGARGVLEKVFRANNSQTPFPLRGTPPWQGESYLIMHGSIVDGRRVIDEVVVGCESEDAFVIHCHGNPLLVERIVKLLQSHGAELTDAEGFAFQRYSGESNSTIEAEAKLAMQKSATLLGVKILQAQIDGGLSTWAQNSVENVDTMRPEAIKQQCVEILERSEIARRIIEGVRIVIAGPPNSGKSTLLNCLAGQQQVLISDTAGTTRDWVSVTCQLGPLRAEFIDTAGLDDVLAGKDTVEQSAQQITKEQLETCDLVLYVVSVLCPQSPVLSHCAVPVIDVYNKCDLVEGDQGVGRSGNQGVHISAKNDLGIKDLTQAILDKLNVVGFDVTGLIAFTQRQRELLSAIVETPDIAKKILEQF